MCGRSGACAASMGRGRSAAVNRRLVECIMPCDTARLGSHERQGRSRLFCGTTSYRVRETIAEIRNRVEGPPLNEHPEVTRWSGAQGPGLRVWSHVFNPRRNVRGTVLFDTAGEVRGTPHAKAACACTRRASAG
jgi:hypothetical protein